MGVSPMSVEMVVITIPAGNTTPVPISFAGASEVVVKNLGADAFVIQTTSDPAELNTFQVDQNESFILRGNNDNRLYIRGLALGAGCTANIMISRRYN